jgi:DNA-directed RNA polymerase subunit M/transcription elongation factor TFIIS/very-short-patch-repair endonuclease
MTKKVLRYNELTTKSFTAKAKKVFGNRYIYSEVDYRGSSIKVKIGCRIHGIFETTPNNHLRNMGNCPKCAEESRAKKRRMGLQEFKKRSKKIHKNKYNYSLISGYKNVGEKVDIKCPIHGIFKQAMSCHLKGQGCPKCDDEKINYNQMTTEEYIRRARKKHKNRYDYSLIGVYKYGKIKVICRKHGLFKINSNNHLRGGGCWQCAVEERGIRHRKPLKKFLSDARKIHGNRYDYSEVVYKNSTTKIKIICPEHGPFLQYPGAHLSGHGCPCHKESKGEILIVKILKRHKIRFIRQKRFSDCRNKNTLPFDFYLPDYNYCIEYDGIQHFAESNPWFNKLIPVNDKIKTNYCKDKGIKLIRISYTDFKRIKVILDEQLKEILK